MKPRDTRYDRVASQSSDSSPEPTCARAFLRGMYASGASTRDLFSWTSSQPGHLHQSGQTTSLSRVLLATWASRQFTAPDVLLKYVVTKGQADCRGKVFDENGKPIAGVIVFADWGGRLDVTSKRGEYVIATSEGNKLIKYYFKKEGYHMSNTIEVMLDSLGICVFAPDVVLKKENK